MSKGIKRLKESYARGMGEIHHGMLVSVQLIRSARACDQGRDGYHTRAEMRNALLGARSRGISAVTRNSGLILAVVNFTP